MANMTPYSIVTRRVLIHVWTLADMATLPMELQNQSESI
jgi:hypothetical protein